MYITLIICIGQMLLLLSFKSPVSNTLNYFPILERIKYGEPYRLSQPIRFLAPTEKKKKSGMEVPWLRREAVDL